MLNSHYVPTYILNFIQTKSLKKIQYKTIIQSNRNIEINFILFKNKYNTKIFDNYITPFYNRSQSLAIDSKDFINISL